MDADLEHGIGCDSDFGGSPAFVNHISMVGNGESKAYTDKEINGEDCLLIFNLLSVRV